MYNSIRLFVLSSLLISTVFTPVFGSNVHVDYNSGYDSQAYQRNWVDEGVAALHVLKNELKNRGEIDLLLWLDGILKEVYYADFGHGYHAYRCGNLVNDILSKMSNAYDKIACLKSIKLQLELEALNHKVVDQAYRIVDLQDQLNTSFFDTVSYHAHGIIPIVALLGTYAMVGLHYAQIRPVAKAAADKVFEKLSLVPDKLWDMAKGLCPYAPKV